MKKIWILFLCALSAGCTPVPRTDTATPIGLDIERGNVVDRGEKFCLPHGINEFDLVEDNGYYYLFSHDFEMPRTVVRRASSIIGLADAEPVEVFVGKYPSVVLHEGSWHAWAFDHQSGHTTHYSAPEWNGPYVRHSDIEIKGADWHVRLNPEDDIFYATYKSAHSLFAGLARSSQPEGPWEDLGWVFDNLPRPGWHNFEEADPSISFQAGRAYMLFAGWNSPSFAVDGGVQRIGIVEVDMQTFKANNSASILLEPIDEWQRRGNSAKVFSPILLRTQSGLRIFYSHNPSSPEVCAGFGVADVIY